MFLMKRARKLRGLGLSFYNRSIGLKPRSEEPYATHVPILLGVAAACKPELLIEFGSGTFSTLLFLNRAAFPSLRKVESYDNNREWFEQVKGKLPSDASIDLHFFDDEMHRAVGQANTANATMIFIDDSPTDKARVPTIVEVARSCGTQPVVVLHDCDLWRLRLATRKFEHRVVFASYNPQSCVMWNGHPERRRAMENVSRIIQKYATSIPATDVAAWINIFSSDLA
jgi:hypothetical protein